MERYGDDAPAHAAVGVEVDESVTRIGVMTKVEGRIHRYHHSLTAPARPAEAVDQIAELVGQVLRPHGDAESGPAGRAADVSGVSIGVAFGGAVDAERGRTYGMRFAEGWDDFPLAQHLTERLRARVRVESSVHCAAYAEALEGVGAGARSMLYITSGRTVSAALVHDGVIVRGAHGLAGAIAHWPVLSQGPRCSCGELGHLEAVASAQAMVRRTIGRASASDESTSAMLAISGGRAEAMTVAQVLRLAGAGDPAAGAVAREALDALGAVAGQLAELLDPDCLVLGGALAVAGDLVTEPLRACIATHWHGVGEPPSVRSGVREPFAAISGALLLGVTAL